MNKLRVSLLIIGTLIAIAAAYFYNKLDIDYIKIGIATITTAISLLIFLKFRNRIKSKAAASAVRRSAGASGVRKFDQKLFIAGILAVLALIIPFKGYTFLIPIGITVLTYILYRFFKVKVFLLIGYSAMVYSAISFTVSLIAPYSSAFYLAYEAGMIIIFLLTLLPLADLYCID